MKSKNLVCFCSVGRFPREHSAPSGCPLVKMAALCGKMFSAALCLETSPKAAYAALPVGYKRPQRVAPRQEYAFPSLLTELLLADYLAAGAEKGGKGRKGGKGIGRY